MSNGLFKRFKRGDVLVKSLWLNVKKSSQRAFHFRIDPVPYTGCYKSYRRSYRHPVTTQEKSKTELFKCELRNGDIEYNIKINEKRNLINMPNSYDDICSSIYYRNRDWKRNKIKKQWMKKILK